MNQLQVVLNCLMHPEQTCAVNGRTILANLHLVCTITEKVNGEAMLINLNQMKAFDRMDYS